MADDDQFHHSSGNWWDTASRNMRFNQSGGTSQSSSSTITNNIVDFAWQNSDMVEIKPRSSMENSSVVFHDNQKLQQPQDSSTSSDPNLHMMGLGLSSHTLDWNQPSLM